MPRRMSNDDSDTEHESDTESDSAKNFGKEVNGEETNVSVVVLVSGECSTGAAVTLGWSLFQEF